jgi:casein kinase 1
MEKVKLHQQQQTDKASSHSNTSTASTIVGVHYQVGKKLGEGSFGVIYEGLNLLNNQSVAIKFEPRKSEVPQLRDEYRTYKILAGTCKFSSIFFFVFLNTDNNL